MPAAGFELNISVPRAGAALLTAVDRNGRVETGKSAVAFSPCEEERETDRDGLVRPQRLEDLERGEPGDRPLGHFLART